MAKCLSIPLKRVLTGGDEVGHAAAFCKIKNKKWIKGRIRSSLVYSSATREVYGRSSEEMQLATATETHRQAGRLREKDGAALCRA